jgi:hypothetical protein
MKSLGLLLAVVAVAAFVMVGTASAEEGKAPSERPTWGELTKIDGKVLTITSRRPGADPVEKTATVDDSTEIFADAPVKLESLKVGDRVRIVQGEKRYSGEVTKIDGKTLTLKPRRGDDQTVTVDDNTKITASVKGKFEDLKVGQFVSASIKDGKAVRVEVRPAGERGPGKKGKEKDKGDKSDK